MKNSPTRTMTAKRIAVAVAAVCATLSAPSFAAGTDVKALMDLLLKKGVISQQEYDQNIQAAAENEAFKEKRLADDVKNLNNIAIKNKDTGAVMKNGLGVQSADGRTTMQLTGRLHMDSRSYFSNAGTDPYQNLLDIRRARLGVRGQIDKDWKYEIVGTYGGNGTTEGLGETATIVDVAYGDYAANPAMQFRFGKFKMPFSLEQLGTSNAIDFMERSLINQREGEWVPAKETGVMVFGSPMSGVTYGLALSKGRANTNTTNDGPDTIGRITANAAEIMGQKGMVAHFGLGYSMGGVSGFSPVSGTTEARGSSAFFTSHANTAALSGATRTRQGAEFAFAYGPVKLQSEYVRVSYDNTGTAGSATGIERGLNATYVQVVYNLTGEDHNYSNSAGTFGWIKPKQPFSAEKGGLGAWQVGIRHSKLQAGEFAQNTSTTNVFTNGAYALTYGLTWFVNDNARMMLNYVDTRFNSYIGSVAPTFSRSNEKAIMARAQYFF
jgi:phosphate-selective porin OprO and OprP